MLDPNLILQLLPIIKGNPKGFASNYGMNIPGGNNDPHSMIAGMMQSGQINQDTYNRAIALARQMGYNL